MFNHSWRSQTQRPPCAMLVYTGSFCPLFTRRKSEIQWSPMCLSMPFCMFVTAYVIVNFRNFCRINVFELHWETVAFAVEKPSLLEVRRWSTTWIFTFVLNTLNPNRPSTPWLTWQTFHANDSEQSCEWCLADLTAPTAAGGLSSHLSECGVLCSPLLAHGSRRARPARGSSESGMVLFHSPVEDAREALSRRLQAPGLTWCRHFGSAGYPFPLNVQALHTASLRRPADWGAKNGHQMNRPRGNPPSQHSSNASSSVDAAKLLQMGALLIRHERDVAALRSQASHVLFLHTGPDGIISSILSQSLEWKRKERQEHVYPLRQHLFLHILHLTLDRVKKIQSCKPGDKLLEASVKSKLIFCRPWWYYARTKEPLFDSTLFAPRAFKRRSSLGSWMWTWYDLRLKKLAQSSLWQLVPMRIKQHSLRQSKLADQIQQALQPKSKKSSWSGSWIFVSRQLLWSILMLNAISTLLFGQYACWAQL